MSPSKVLNSAFEMYGAHWQHLIGIGLVIWVGVGIIAALLSLLGIVGALLALIVIILGSVLLQGAIVTAVDDLRDGRADLSIQETLSAAMPYLLPLIGAGIVVGILVAIGLVILIVPGLILLTFWFVTAPSIVIEDRGVIGGMSRSWNLVKGYGWPTFGLVVMTFLLLFVAGIVASLILSFLPDFLAALLSNIVVNSVVGPFWAVVSALAFFALRDARNPEQESAGDTAA